MNYLPLESLKNAWIFKHKSLPITDADLVKIKPMSTERANILWDTFISRQADHPDFFILTFSKKVIGLPITIIGQIKLSGKEFGIVTKNNFPC